MCIRDSAICALVSAFISALFISPGVVSWMGIDDLRMMGIIYLMIGLVFWQVAPFLSRLLVKAIPNVIGGMIPGNKNSDNGEPK